MPTTCDSTGGADREEPAGGVDDEAGGLDEDGCADVLAGWEAGELGVAVCAAAPFEDACAGVPAEPVAAWLTGWRLGVLAALLPG